MVAQPSSASRKRYDMMKTMNYNVCAITAKNGVAVAMFANKKHKDVFAATNKLALLQAFSWTLDRIKDNDELMDKPAMIITTKSILKGFTTGSYIEYIRTGCDANGNKFTDEEFQLVCECAQKLSTKSFNIRLVDEQMVSPKDVAAVQVKRDAFTVAGQLANAQTKQQQAQRPTRPVQQAPVNPVLAKLEKLMNDALDAGDITKYDEYKARYDQFNAPAPAPQTTNEVEVPADETPFEQEEKSLADQVADFDL